MYDSATTCVVAENAEGVIIGCGTAKVVRRDGLNVNERAGHILTLAVDPTWRRQGLGRDLLEVTIPIAIIADNRRLLYRYEPFALDCQCKRDTI